MKKRLLTLLLLIGLLTAQFPALSAGAQSEPPADAVIQPTQPVSPTPTEESPLPPQTTVIPDPPATDEPPATGELPPQTDDLPPTTGELPPSTEDDPDYAALLYGGLYAVIQGGEPLFSLSTKVELEQSLLASACTRLLERVPQFFYLKAIDVSIATLPTPDEDGNHYRYDLRPVYTFAPGEELDAACAYVQAETAKILAKIPQGASPFEQVLFLHDYLCVTFAYDGTHTVGDLYNLLKSGHGVCQAYVALYAYLLDQLGIRNDFAISDEMNHIWNMVELGGEWYHIDLTWNDPVADQPGRALHGNFLRSDAGIAATGHTGWVADHVCTSDLYERSILPQLGSAILFAGDTRYAVHSSNRTLVRFDPLNLTGEAVLDLSPYRWSVWESPALYKGQYINLYFDGYLLYFNGPDSIYSFDPAAGRVELLFEHLPSAGYLYSLKGDGHTLTCTVGKAPGDAIGTVSFTTPHRYGTPTDGLLATSDCLLCGHREHFLAPAETDPITALLSTRIPGEGLHDLRLLLLISEALLTEDSAPLQITLTLQSPDGDRWVTTSLSLKDLGDLLIYERILAGGKEYAVLDGYGMYGLLLRNLDCDSYTAVQVTVMQGDTLLYSALTDAAHLPGALTPPPATLPPITEELPQTDELPATEDIPSTGNPPLTGEAPFTGEVPVTSDLPITADPPATGHLPLTNEAPITELPPATGEVPLTDDIPIA